ncbi:MAG: methyltransferase [Candidatus Eremiobacteraeota bacterium]|nr:methyltransferase [Candidatus Eremiobacteraeota bacterium]
MRVGWRCGDLVVHRVRRDGFKQGFREGGRPGDLFAGAARFYAAYRRVYPQPVVAYMVDEFGLDGRGRLMDGGCGTGQLFLVLARYFHGVFAFDSDEEMVALARRAADEHELSNVIVKTASAEEIGPGLGTFRLASFAASFHWMDRQLVAERVYDLLEPGGYLAVLAPESVHAGTEDWEVFIRELIARWLGPRRRAGSGIYNPAERHAEALARTRFAATIKTAGIFVEETWSTDEIVGWLFSTSYASHAVLAEDAVAFERELRAGLAAIEPSGRFTKTAEHTVISAKRVR